MDIKSSWSCAFDFEDIEIIDHKKENEEKLEFKWNCDQCSLFFLEKEKLEDHKKKHSEEKVLKCRYCNKALAGSVGSKVSFINRKCETCEYRCSKCPKRFLRHSSLLNHEKNHSVARRKKRVTSSKKVNGICLESGANSKATKRKQVEVGEEEDDVKTKKIMKVRGRPKKKLDIKTETQVVEEVCESLPVKTTKRLSLKDNRMKEEKNSVSTKTTQFTNNSPNKKQNNIPNKRPNNNPVAAALTPNTQSSDNVVNYKPFSCHVCGDTFASDNALLEHIRTHGENAATNFKCKYCGDEFDDIYQMQYHLAICPLAEDELECSLQQPPPTKYLKPAPSGSTPGVRKRGRPRKTFDPVVDQEDSEDEFTPSSIARRSMKKIKAEEPEDDETVLEVTTLSMPKRTRNKLQQNSTNKQKSEPHNNCTGEELEKDPFSGIGSESGEQNDADDTSDRKKLHQCPFPRCDFKFTREKALLCHMRNHSDDFDDSLKCHKCDIPFDDIHTLRLHINTCKGIKEEKDDDFNDSNYADTHDATSKQFRIFPKTRGEFVCNKCERSYQTQERLSRHLESLCSSKLVCRVCKDEFDNQPLLDEHFTSKHPTKTPYHCYMCNEDFISELFLQIHQTDYHGQATDESPITDITVQDSSKARTVGNIQSSVGLETSRDNDCVSARTFKKSCHPSIVTSGKRRVANKSRHHFRCAICLESFDERETMRHHLRSEHVFETSSKYSCELCEIEMPYAEMLCYHLEIHSSNILTVNRFSKLRSGGNQRSLLGVKVKSEDVSDNEEANQVDQTLNKEITEISYDKSASSGSMKNKLLKGKVGSQSNIKPKSNQVFKQKSRRAAFRLSQKLNFGINSKKVKYKKTLKRLNKKKRQCLVGAVSVVERSNTNIPESRTIKSKKDVIKMHRNQGEISFNRQTRNLRSRMNQNEESSLNKTDIESNNQQNKIEHENIIRGESLLDDCNNRYADKSDMEMLGPIGGKNKDLKAKLRSRSVRLKRPLCLSTKRDLDVIEQINVHNPGRDIKSEHSSSEVEENIISGNKFLNQSSNETDIKKDLGDEPKKRVVRRGRRLGSRTKRKGKKGSTSCKSVVEDEKSSDNQENSPTIESALNENSENAHKEENPNLPSEKNVYMNIEVNSKPDVRNRLISSQSTEEKELSIIEVASSESVDTDKDVQSEGSTDMPETQGGNEEQSVEQHSENPSPAGIQHAEEDSSSEPSEEICCTMCTMSFYNQDELLDHVATHIYHPCIGFERGSIVKKDLRRHKCNVCQAVFESEWEENDHMVKHARKVAGYPCRRCFLLFPCHESVALHLKKCATRDLITLTEALDYSMMASKMVKVLFDGKDGKPSLKCVKCRKCFTKLTSLRDHKCVAGRSKLFRCISCKLSFGSKELLVKHHKTHLKKKLHLCLSCNRKFLSKTKLENHENKYHCRSIKCSICSKVVLRVALAEHMHNEHMEKVNTFECEICKISIFGASSFIDHLMFHAYENLSKKENSESQDTTYLLDTCEEKKENRESPQRFSCRPSLCHNKMFTTLSIRKSKSCGFLPNLSIGKSGITTKTVSSQILRCKENIYKNYNCNHDCSKLADQLGNAENGKENKFSSKSENIWLRSSENRESRTDELTEDVMKYICIKPCYVPLVNINCEFRKPVSASSRSVDADLKIITETEKNSVPSVKTESRNSHSTSHIKQEEECKELIILGEHITLKCDGAENCETTLPPLATKIKTEKIDEEETLWSDDSEDSVALIREVSVHKCVICLQVFDSVEQLQSHVIVHF